MTAILIGGGAYPDGKQTDIYTEIPAPRVNADLTYTPCKANRKIRVYHKMNSRLTLEDFFANLQINFPEQNL